MSDLSQSFLQDSAGTTATYIDLTFRSEGVIPTNYDRTDVVRTVVLRDAYGEVLDSVTLPATEEGDTFDYALTADHSVRATLTYTGAVSDTLTNDYPFERITNLLFKEKINPSSCCTSKSQLTNRVNALLFATGARYTETTTDLVSFNIYIAAENAYLNLL